MSEFNADHPTTPGSSITSIQRGTISLGAGSNPQVVTATITEVDVDKSILSWLGVRTTHDGSAKGQVNLVLSNSTTISATRDDATNTSIVSWQIVEWS
jgi:hypothetical protein|tara:strand:+ start:199 stop:492 length:294 start_codon:yes stop_codon:yes gene_type:complete